MQNPGDHPAIIDAGLARLAPWKRRLDHGPSLI